MARQSAYQEIQALYAQAKSLPELEQAVWHKARINGYTPGEAAAALGIPLKDVFAALDSAEAQLATRQEKDS